MAIASSLPSTATSPTEQSLMTEIVDYVNKQSNGQLAERIRTSMSTLVGALDKQTSDMLSIKGHPLKWLLEDKKTVDAVKHFNRVLQTSVKLYSTNLQNLNVKLTTWSKETSESLDTISTGFSGMIQETSHFVGILRNGREKVMQMIENVTTEFDPSRVNQTKSQAPNNQSNEEIKSIATNILGAIISNGLIVDKRLGELHQDNRFLQHIATNQDSGVIPALDAIKLAIDAVEHTTRDQTARLFRQAYSSDKQLSNWMEMVHDQSVEAQQDAEFNSKKLVVTVAGFNSGAIDQLKRLSNTKQQYDESGNETKTSSGGGGLLSLLGLGAIGAGTVSTSGMLSPLMALLRPILRRLPIIGTLINFGLGIQRLVRGDVVGGVTQMAAGIAYMFPGVGTAIGIGLDVLLYARDKQGNGVENLAKGRNDIFKQAWVVIAGKMQEWWDAISVTVSDFLTLTLPKWLQQGGKQLSEVWNWFNNPNTIAVFSGFIDGAITSIKNFISGPEGLTKKIGQFFEGLKTTIPALGEQLIEYLTNNKGKLYDKFLGPDNAIGNYAIKILGALGNIAVSMGKLLWSVSSSLFDLVATLWSNVFKNSWEGAKQLYGDYVAPIVDPLIQNIKQFPKRIWDWFKSTGPGKFLFGLFEGLGKIASGNTEEGIKVLDASVMPGISAVYEALQKDSSGTIAGILDYGTGTKVFSKTLNTAKTAKQKVGNAVDWFKGLWGEGTVTAPQVVNDAIISNGKVVVPNKDDQIWAAKPGGPIDKAITKSNVSTTKHDQQQLQSQLIKQLQKVLQDTLSQAIAGQGQMLSQIISSMPIGASSGGGSGDSSPYTGDRDPAYIHRMKAWQSISPPARMAY